MKKKNFTLVEIMIVVAIIAVLAAIAVPALAANRDSAVERSKVANVKMVKAAINSYLSDHISKNRDDVTSAGFINEYLDTNVSTMSLAGSDLTVTASTVSYSE